MAKNGNLHAAKNAKNDEFYTQMSDIERELYHYREHFKGKTVLCNCDDPYESNFVKYFALNFKVLELKRLISTCYITSPVMFMDLNFIDFRLPYVIDVDNVGEPNAEGGCGLPEFQNMLMKNRPRPLKGDGDFRSAECIEYLKQADIVVTNPPFSLFREYVALLMKYDKKFIIVGNQNAITYKEIFPLIQQNKMWLGYKSGDMAFRVPANYEARETRFWIDDNGQKWRSLGNICWFTNLEISKRYERMILTEHYTPDKYPKYDNYNAINIDRTADIPCDYDGIMGVPITFLDKHNPEQFDILGLDKEFTIDKGRGKINGQVKYARIFIRKRVKANADNT